MGLFDNIGDEDVAHDRRYDVGGTYIEFIERVAERVTRASGDAVFLEKKVVMVIDAKDEPKPHYPGEKVTHMMTSNNKDYFLKNVKTFITQIGSQLMPGVDLGELSNESWATLANNVMGEKQPFAGHFFMVDNTTFTSDKTGKDWTRVVYNQHLTASQVKEMVLAQEKGAELLKRVWPSGELDDMIAAESETA